MQTAIPNEHATQKKLRDQVRDALRVKHYSIRTEQAYTGWSRRYILFHNKRHPQEMGAPEITAFLTYLAVDQNVAASTQNQARAALLFLYREVLKMAPGHRRRARQKAQAPAYRPDQMRTDPSTHWPPVV